MLGESLFRADVLAKAALKIRDKMVSHMSIRMEDIADEEEKKIVGNRIKQMNDFKASNAWGSNFMKRKVSTVLTEWDRMDTLMLLPFVSLSMNCKHS